MRLSLFFQEPYIELALNAYVVARPNWDITAKIDLYRCADIAFDPSQPEIERRKAFCTIYNELKSYWKVFRNAQNYWDADTAFLALTTLPSCRRDIGTTLMSLKRDVNGVAILHDLQSLRKLKQNAAYPYMAVSKFLHFSNPGLFPIFDIDAVWNTVCNGAFKYDYRDFCERHILNPNELSGRFNLNYTLWASELVKDADPRFMAIFAEWAMRQMPNISEAETLTTSLSTYYATAFEFVAVGAAHWARTS